MVANMLPFACQPPLFYDWTQGAPIVSFQQNICLDLTLPASENWIKL